MTIRNEILVTGANGFLGRILVKFLDSKNWCVIAGTRLGDGTTRSSVASVSYGSFPNIRNLSSTLQRVQTIVHCAGRAHVSNRSKDNSLANFRRVNRDGTIALARQAADAGVERFIFISSIGVNGNQTTDMPFKADDPPDPQAAYAVSKFEAECELSKLSIETGLNIIIIRPPLIVGSNPVGNLGVIERLLKKKVPLPFGAATKNKRSVVSGNTLASLVEVCLTHPRALNQVFLISNGSSMHTRAIFCYLAREVGHKVRFLPVPLFLLRLLLKVTFQKGMEGQLLGNLEVDISKTIRRLNWKPHDNYFKHETR